MSPRLRIASRNGVDDATAIVNCGTRSPIHVIPGRKGQDYNVLTPSLAAVTPTGVSS